MKEKLIRWYCRDFTEDNLKAYIVDNLKRIKSDTDVEDTARWLLAGIESAAYEGTVKKTFKVIYRPFLFTEDGIYYGSTESKFVEALDYLDAQAQFDPSCNEIVDILERTENKVL